MGTYVVKEEHNIKERGLIVTVDLKKDQDYPVPNETVGWAGNKYKINSIEIGSTRNLGIGLSYIPPNDEDPDHTFVSEQLHKLLVNYELV